MSEHHGLGSIFSTNSLTVKILIMLFCGLVKRYKLLRKISKSWMGHSIWVQWYDKVC